MESEVEKPVLTDRLGYRMDNGPKGQCFVCKAHIFKISSCYICKKIVCGEHTYFFMVGDKEVALCPEDYRKTRNEFDMWQAHKPKWRPKEKNEK